MVSNNLYRHWFLRTKTHNRMKDGGGGWFSSSANVKIFSETIKKEQTVLSTLTWKPIFSHVIVDLVDFWVMRAMYGISPCWVMHISQSWPLILPLWSTTAETARSLCPREYWNMVLFPFTDYQARHKYFMTQLSEVSGSDKEANRCPVNMKVLLLMGGERDKKEWGVLRYPSVGRYCHFLCDDHYCHSW